MRGEGEGEEGRRGERNPGQVEREHKKGKAGLHAISPTLSETKTCVCLGGSKPLYIKFIHWREKTIQNVVQLSSQRTNQASSIP